jgi:microcystin-dependent protein
MGQPFVGEIRLFAGNFAIDGWAFCNGQLLSISENETLFQLIGTTYGGDGSSTFAVPDLRGRAPIHLGTGPGLGTYVIGQSLGVESVTLNTNQLPAHTHVPLANSGPGSGSPANAVWAAGSSILPYNTAAPDVQMQATVGPAGGSQPHENMSPFLAMNYIISLFGIFPSQN